jgi:hypothetical protein
MPQRYVLYPGLVTGRSEANFLYLGASALARLHGVDMRDCVVFDPALADPESYHGCIHLYPPISTTGNTRRPRTPMARRKVNP